MTDSPYYRPSDGEGDLVPIADQTKPADDAPPRSVRKTRRPQTEPVEPEAWVVAFSDTDPLRTERYRDGLSRRGIWAVPRVDRDTRLGPWRDARFPGPKETYQVVVPDTQAELAAALVEGPVGEEVDALEEHVTFSPQLDDDYFVLRSRMEVEMPNATPRQRDRAARRALEDLEGLPVSSREDLPPRNTLRTQMITVMIIVLIATAVLLVGFG